MKSKFSVFFFLLSLSVLFTGQALAMTVSYDQKVSIDSNPVATIKVLVREEQMRAESDFNGVVSVLYRNVKGTYSYLPQQKMAALLPAALDRPNITRDIPKYMEFLEKNEGKKTGTETINGVECDVYTFTEPNILRPGKAWIWREKSFPVKIEVDAPEGKTSIEISNVNFTPTVQDSDFELPSDAKIFDPNTMFPNKGDDKKLKMPRAQNPREANTRN